MTFYTELLHYKESRTEFVRLPLK